MSTLKFEHREIRDGEPGEWHSGRGPEWVESVLRDHRNDVVSITYEKEDGTVREWRISHKREWVPVR